MNIITIKGQKASKFNDVLLVSDAVNFPFLSCNFDKSWDNLNKTYQFTNGDVTIDLETNEQYIPIPQEVLKPGILIVKIKGTKLNIDGDIVTKRATMNPLQYKVTDSMLSIDTFPPEEVTPDKYEQIRQMAEDAVQTAESVKQDADEGKFDGEKGDTGNPGVVVGTPPEYDEEMRIWIDPNGTSLLQEAIDDLILQTVTAKNQTIEAKNIVISVKNFVIKIKNKILGIKEDIDIVKEDIDLIHENVIDLEESAGISAFNAKDSETEASNYADIAANNILNGVNTHNDNPAAHESIRDSVDRVESIARGKANAEVFATREDMYEWLEDTENTDTLTIGDNLYIVDIGVPDYWWDGETVQELEAEAPRLVDYYTKLQVQMLLPLIISREDYDMLVSTGQVEAGRLYDIIEEEVEP